MVGWLVRRYLADSAPLARPNHDLQPPTYGALGHGARVPGHQTNSCPGVDLEIPETVKCVLILRCDEYPSYPPAPTTLYFIAVDLWSDWPSRGWYKP